jgi:flagellin
MVDSVGGLGSAFAGLQALDLTNTSLRKSASITRFTAPDESGVVQTLKSRVGELRATQFGVSRAQSIAEVSTSAGRNVQDQLFQLRDVAKRAADPTVGEDERAQASAAFDRLKQEVDATVDRASFGGVNLLSEGGRDVEVTVDRSGNKSTLRAQDLSTKGLGIDDATAASSTSAAQAVDALDAAISTVEDRLAALEKDTQTIKDGADFPSKLLTTIEPGVAGQVNPNLTEEEADALVEEVRRGLGVQSLSVANVKSQSLLAFLQA